MFYIVSPFYGTASEQSPFPPHCTALPNCCPISVHRGTAHEHPPSRDLTSVLGDVAHPRQGLVAALLNDLQVAHLSKGERRAREERRGEERKGQRKSIPPVSLLLFFKGAVCDSGAAVCVSVMFCLLHQQTQQVLQQNGPHPRSLLSSVNI